jgi:iodotyrosine deiodinase
MFSRSRLAYLPIPLPDRVELRHADHGRGGQLSLSNEAPSYRPRVFVASVPRSFIETSIRNAGLAPSGANHQPLHFVASAGAQNKRRIRQAAEEEERRFYTGGAGDEWLNSLEPIGTRAEKSHLEIAPWLIVIFAQRWGAFDDSSRFKN